MRGGSPPGRSLLVASSPPLEVSDSCVSEFVTHDRIGRARAEVAPIVWPPRRFLGTSASLRQGRTPPTVSDMTGLTQPWHIILILLIALMLFGGRRLPEVGRSLGTGMREFKDSITGHDSPEPSEQLNPTETTASAAQPTEREAA